MRFGYFVRGVPKMDFIEYSDYQNGHVKLRVDEYDIGWLDSKLGF